MTLLEWCEANEDIDKQGEHIIKQWTGIDEYGNTIDIKNIAAKSGKKLLWRCSKGHTWIAKVIHRTSCLSGCPFCSKLNQSNKTRKGKLRVGENDLLTWCNNNGEYGLTLKKEFIGLTDNNENISIESVSYGSKLIVQWKCNNGHQWNTSINTRTNSKTMCPYCSGNKMIEGKNDLYSWCMEHNRTDLIKEFMGEDENGDFVDIHNIFRGSNKKVKWRHIANNNEEHIWTSTIKHRTINNSRCPYCNGSKKILSGFNDLLTWCNRNDDFGNIIKSEYTGIDIHRNIIDIDKIAPFSYTKLLWRHTTKSGEIHEWYSSLYNRISHRTLCPLCNNKGTSLPEQIIFRCIKQVYPNTISRGKFQGYEFDITIPELKICIEYGSTYYHIGREQRDKEKAELCKKYNVRFIQIIDDSNNELTETWEDNLIITHISIEKISDIEKIVKFLAKKLKIKYTDINFNKAVNDAIDFMGN